MSVVDVTADGDTLFAEISHGGTMEGPMGLREPTGQSYRVQGAFRFEVTDGKIRSILSCWDTAAMARQLGFFG
jgi:predicted ester cyclase